MAAGESKRFCGCKQLADLHGKPLIQNALDESEQLNAAKRIVVTGRWHHALDCAKQEGAIPECDLVFNPEWNRGLGNSISFGVAQLADQCDGILILLADQVEIDASGLQALIDSLGNHQIACAKYNGTRGVPALFRKALFPELLGLTGEKGAKPLLSNERLDVVELEMPSAAIDIDTRDQLTALNEKRASSSLVRP
ncbi:nucleotidyltransferase family protein [Pontibacterium granulatum]|uniref:nucleotidyltransferase family protein n=1 Tax=Pontibacterium granulatum TaxID=2036029 RepID=UPI00249B89E0|nr:nucleotidyltransferase family protein [Pontibacterium granulatum]MDI3324068.1 nucleotidyltransferase family protein [Pontibacterium granulatum]